jgi:hypothetical protein
MTPGCYEAQFMVSRIALMMTIPQLAKDEKACSSEPDDYHQQSNRENFD